VAKKPDALQQLVRGLIRAAVGAKPKSPYPRKTLSKKRRYQILERDKFTCRTCGRSAPEVALHVDHIIPVSKGGNNTLENLQTLCVDCNLGKGNQES